MGSYLFCGLLQTHLEIQIHIYFFIKFSNFNKLYIYYKQAWLDYSFINISGYSDKFFADNLFKKTIIKLNKGKTKPSANIATNDFLREIVSMFILSL